LNEALEIQRRKLQKIADLKKLGESKIVWYRDKNGKRVEWHDEDARNITLNDEALISQDDPKDGLVTELIVALDNNGFSEETNIILAIDKTINESVVVDGVHRLVVLFYHLLNN